jgi:BirA family transcriptional regulator, biotin operon repressor / biotin---[acetyl-CoA-carboxylase] ligase
MKTELTTLFTGRRIIKFASVDSTNRYLAKLFSDAGQYDHSNGTALLADYQSAGQGMAGNQWHSEKGKNLLLSILFLPSFLQVNKVFLFNKAMALGVYHFITTQLSSISPENKITIKWPNDIYAGDKKLCGIKMENAIRGMHIQHVILGIGLNINQTDFPSDLINPTSLRLITGKDFSLDVCFNALCNELEKQYLRLKAGHEKEIKEDYLRALYRKDELSWYSNASGKFQGIIKDVDKEGRLCLESEGNLFKYEVKELKFLI